MKLYNEEDIPSEVNSFWKKARNVQEDWRKEAKEDFNFAAGHQWDAVDVEKLKAQNRPIVTFNRCNPILSAILGMEANQRQQTSYSPRGKTDSKLSEAIDFVCDWAKDYTESEVEEAQAFEDMLTCGMGWTDFYMNYEVDLDGKIVQEVLNPLDMAWDVHARKRNLTDAEWICHGKKMSVDEITDRWPDADLSLTEDDIRDLEGEDDNITNVNPRERYLNDLPGEGKTKKRPVVLRFQWYEREPVWRVVLPMSDQIFELDQEKYEKVEAFLAKQGAKTLKQYRRKYYEAFVYGETLLEKKEAPSQSGFTLKCLTGKRDKINNTWYGIVRLMKDPQRWANKFFSTFIDIIDSNAKGGLLVEEGAVSDQRDFEEKWSQADSIAWVRQGALANKRIDNKPAPNYPQGTDKLMQFAIQSIYDCTGMNMEMLGLADRAQPNMLEETRKKSAFTILAPFFDALRAFRKESGIVFLEFIKNYLPVKRIEEVLEPELKPFAQIIKQVDLRQINIVVTEAPSSDNHKMVVWAFFSQVAPQLLKAGIPIPPEILDYSPLPAPLVEKWKQMLTGKANIPPQMQKQMQMMQQKLQELSQENVSLRAGEKSKLAELALKKNISDQEMKLKAAEIQQDFANKRQQQQFKVEKLMLDLKSDMEQFVTDLKVNTMKELQVAKMENETEKHKHMVNAGTQMTMHKESMRNESKETTENV